MKAYLLPLMIFIFLVGCSTATVKYQCTDGTFVTAKSNCDSKSVSESSCPEPECDDCPPKIEYQDRMVEKEVYVDKTVYRYQCYDGTITDSLSKCPFIEQVRRDTKFEPKPNFCRDENNYNIEKITFTPYSVWQEENLGEQFSTSQYSSNSWYPSLSEGYIGYYGFKVNNEGCTKLDKKQFKVSYYLYHNDKLIFTQEKTNKLLNWFIYQDDIFPQEDDVIRRGIGYDNSDYLFKITDDGEYILKITVYYKDKLVGSFEDMILIK